MYKAVFIDIDGTLRDNKKNISDRTINAIKHITENGIMVILSSGRPQKYTENISRKCYASNYVITSSGASIYDYESKNVVYQNVMNKQACIDLYNLSQNAGVRFSMNVGEIIVTNRLKYLDGSEKLLNEPIENFVINNNVFQCNIADKEYNKMKKLIPLIRQVPNCEIKNMHKSLTDEAEPQIGDIYCDVASVDSCKGNAVKVFCDMLGIDLKATIAIGDDFNDVSMFDVVGYSVAMGNSNDIIKKHANEVTLSNEEDGVAIFLEKLLTNSNLQRLK